MKKTIGFLSAVAFGLPAMADVNVGGYIDAGYAWQKDAGGNFLYDEGAVYLSGSEGNVDFMVDVPVSPTTGATTLTVMGATAQAYAKVSYDSGFSWTLGQWDSALGMEALDSVDRSFINNGAIRGLLPTVHRGVNFGYDMSDLLGLSLWVDNGKNRGSAPYGALALTDGKLGVGFNIAANMDTLKAKLGGYFWNSNMEFDLAVMVEMGVDLGVEVYASKPDGGDMGLAFGLTAENDFNEGMGAHARFEYLLEDLVGANTMVLALGPHFNLGDAYTVKLDYTLTSVDGADAGHGVGFSGVYKF